MSVRIGRCSNYGLCVKADIRENQTIPDGVDFVCQECKRPLVPLAVTPSGGSRSSAVPVVVGAILLALLAGGLYYLFKGRQPSGDASGSTGALQSTPLPAGAVTLLRLSGSNTIGAQLGPELIQAWLMSKGATNVQSSRSGDDETRVTGTLQGRTVTVEVRAHGSATAFTDLVAGTADVGMASRRVKQEEAMSAQAKGLGDLTTNAAERVLGLDGVAVIVNESNATDAMTKDEVASIFAGVASGKQWNVYARDAKSGTYDTFKDRVLGSQQLVASAKRFEDNRELAAAVARDHDGIGFVGLPYAVGVKSLAISEKGTSPRIPNAMTVRTEAYALSRRLYLYVPEGAKPEAREFVNFALSPAGQDIVEKAGFVGQKVELMTTQQAPPSAPQGYVQLLPTGDRLSVDFRFRTGSSQLDTKAVDDVKRVASALSGQYAGRKVMLVGFADNTGSAASNVTLSKSRAEAVAEQMRRQGIEPVMVTGFGPELPVADNSTEDGREKNRRVEVWLRK